MIHPVVLCGGSGTRLWPLSRKEYPKQFATFLGPESLLQATLRRTFGAGFAAPLMMTHADFRFILRDQMAAVGIADADILLEPDTRNTAPSVAAAAACLAQRGHSSDLMLVMPADHILRDIPAFHRAIIAGTSAAQNGALVCFGINPDRPETGYGYLDMGPSLDPEHPAAAAMVRRFVEKPNEQGAIDMLSQGNFLWNSGIFLFRVGDLIAAFEALAPDIMEAARRAVAGGRRDLDFLRLDAAAFAAAPADSLDYAIMEKTTQVVAVPMDCGWSDIGAWDAVWREMDQDNDGCAQDGDVTAVNCTNTLLRSENEGPHLVGVNLDNIAVVAMQDAVLVADLSDMQAVKAAVAQMEEKAVPQAVTFPRTYRPWGWYRSLAQADRFQVKHIVVPPGKKLSLQSHVHRAEHWIVVCGTARVTIADAVQLVSENQSVYIPLGTIHRLENPGKVDLHLIEVQTGTYLGEDDITRYEDIYDRDCENPA